MNELKYHRKPKYYLSSTLIKVLIAWFFIVLYIIQASAITSLVTDTATGITASQVTMNAFGTIDDPTADVWFEYGGSPGHYIFRTDAETFTVTPPQVVSPARTISGLPLQAHQTYYYRVVADSKSAGGAVLRVYGNEESFTMTDLTETEARYNNFSGHLDELTSARLNVTKTTTTLPKPYTDIMGGIFWGVAFGFIFVMIFLRQEDIGIPALLGLLIGSFLFTFLPPEWVQIAYMLLIVSFGALVFSLIKGRG